VEAPLFKGQHYSASPWGSLISSARGARRHIGQDDCHTAIYSMLTANMQLFQDALEDEGRCIVAGPQHLAGPQYSAGPQDSAEPQHSLGRSSRWSTAHRWASDDKQHFLELLIETLKWRRWSPTRCCNHWSFRSQ
jgi:hypothetical protein